MTLNQKVIILNDLTDSEKAHISLCISVIVKGYLHVVYISKDKQKSLVKSKGSRERQSQKILLYQREIWASLFVNLDYDPCFHLWHHMILYY